MKYSLCLEPIFNSISFYDRFAAAKEIGYDAVEFWDAAAYDVAKIEKAANTADIPVAAMTLIDNWGVRVSDDYRTVLKNAEESIRIGEQLGCKSFIGLSGDVTAKNDNQKNILIENLKRLGELFEKNDAVLVLEALNSIVDHKGYYLDSSLTGFEIVRCVDSPGVRLLYDIYHMQIMEGNVIQNITSNISYIGHFHCAGVPGRNEPQKGELNYGRIVPAIEATGYDGYFGLEYWPTGDHTESAAQVLAYMRRCSEGKQ